MKKGIIILNQTLGHNDYKVKRFKEEAKLLDIDISLFVNDGSLYSIVNGEIKLNIPHADFVIYLDKDIYLCTALEKKGYYVINSSDFIRICDDKALTSVIASNLDIAAPKTITPPLIYEDEISEERLNNFSKNVSNNFIYPVIGKLSFSSLGKGVFLLQNEEEVKEFYLKYFSTPFIIQEYIESFKSNSIRIIIIGEQIIGAIQRINENDFRSNIGTNYSKIYQLDEKCLTFARNIAEKLHIKYAGVDVLLDKDNNPLLCEINSNAFFEEFEKTTHINVAKTFLEFVINDLGKE